MTEPVLETRCADGGTRAVALFCHGGTVASVEPPRERALSLVRMRAIEQFVAAAANARGVTTCLLRYRVAGWNGAAADAFADVRWSLDRIRAEHGTGVPIVLVGHSMGGRAVLRAGGEEAVSAVCALAPWTPPGEPVTHLRDRTVAILHGRGDRWVPAALSAQFFDGNWDCRSQFHDSSGDEGSYGPELAPVPELAAVPANEIWCLTRDDAVVAHLYDGWVVTATGERLDLMARYDRTRSVDLIAAELATRPARRRSPPLPELSPQNQGGPRFGESA